MTQQESANRSTKIAAKDVNTAGHRPSYRCAVIDDYQRIAHHLADWTGLAPSIEVDFYHQPFGTTFAAVAALHNYDIVVAMRERTRFSASLIRQLEKLKLLITTGMRNDSIDIAVATGLGITVCGTRGFGQPTAELTWGVILSALRRLPTEFRNMEEGRWQTTLGFGLFGKRLGIIGLGNVGAQVSRIGRSFGMQVTAWSQNLTTERCDEIGVGKASSLEALLSSSDVVTIHLKLSQRTRGLIGKEEINSMKPTALLVNTSRAAIVNQDAMLAAIQERRIWGAAVDVYDEEPLPVEHPFRNTPRLFALPHIGFVTEENLQSNYCDAVEDIDAWLSNTPIRFING